MLDKLAEEVINEWNREDNDASTMLSLYQQVANHFFQRENAITTTRTPGEDKSLPVIDPTGKLDLQDMAAGMSAVILPPGQYFCRLSASEERLAQSEIVRSYLAYATQVLHTEIYKSNFVLQFNEFLQSLIGFGTGCLYSVFDTDEWKLRFKDWDIANYRFGVDGQDRPNKCLIQWTYTAQQAYDLFGNAAGEKVVKFATDADNPKQADEKFVFLYRVRPRKHRNTGLRDNLNFPFDEVVVNKTEKVTVRESGYEQFPYHICRWLLSSQARYGFGQGTVALSADKELQQQRRALILNADLANNPPRQTLHSFEGTPKVYPGANNTVMEMDSIRALDGRLNGNFPITKDTVEMTQEIIHRCFYVKVFAPLDHLPGDRRTTVEIIERVKAGYMRLVQPTMRLYNECLTPLVERCVLQLLKYRVLEPPPPELRSFKVDYLGRLALALQEQQADALMRYSQFSLQMEQIMPGFTEETISRRRAGRRMATTMGVNENDLTTDEERQEILDARQQREQQMMQMQMAEIAAKGYKNASGAAEPGSPAEAMMSGA